MRRRGNEFGIALCLGLLPTILNEPAIIMFVHKRDERGKELSKADEHLIRSTRNLVCYSSSSLTDN